MVQAGRQAGSWELGGEIGGHREPCVNITTSIIKTSSVMIETEFHKKQHTSSRRIYKVYFARFKSSRGTQTDIISIANHK